MGSKNTFSRALKHLKSTQIDEGMPTNNTQGLMTVGDPSRYIPPEAEVVEYLDFDKDNDDDDGKNTDGIFLSDGTILTVEPPGDTSYVLGPMSSMWYAWGNFTRIGYIRQSDRKMVNLGSITGELGDWDGSADDFTSYGQLTLEQAVWFKNIGKKDGGGNDDPNYRAFYPGPPSNTPDAFGRYLCVITGIAKDFGYERKGYTTKPDQGASSPEDNFSAQDARDKGKGDEGIFGLSKDQWGNIGKGLLTALQLGLDVAAIAGILFPEPGTSAAGVARIASRLKGFRALQKWFNRGRNQRVPNENQASWKTLRADDAAQGGKFVKKTSRGKDPSKLTDADFEGGALPRNLDQLGQFVQGKGGATWSFNPGPGGGLRTGPTGLSRQIVNRVFSQPSFPKGVIGGHQQQPTQAQIDAKAADVKIMMDWLEKAEAQDKAERIKRDTEYVDQRVKNIEAGNKIMRNLRKGAGARGAAAMKRMRREGIDYNKLFETADAAPTSTTTTTSSTTSTSSSTTPSSTELLSVNNKADAFADRVIAKSILEDDPKQIEDMEGAIEEYQENDTSSDQEYQTPEERKLETDKLYPNVAKIGNQTHFDNPEYVKAMVEYEKWHNPKIEAEYKQKMDWLRTNFTLGPENSAYNSTTKWVTNYHRNIVSSKKELESQYKNATYGETKPEETKPEETKPWWDRDEGDGELSDTDYASAAAATAEKKKKFKARMAELDAEIAGYDAAVKAAHAEMRNIVIQFGIDAALTIFGGALLKGGASAIKALRGYSALSKAQKAAKTQKAWNALAKSSSKLPPTGLGSPSAAPVSAKGADIFNKFLAKGASKTPLQQQQIDAFRTVLNDTKTLERAHDAIKLGGPNAKFIIRVGKLKVPVKASEVLNFKGFQANSHIPQGRVITESSFTPRQRKILREIRTPYKMPEIPTKFKVKPKGRVVGGGLMKSESVPPQFKSTSDNRMWRKYEYKENIRASQEKKNQVLELIGEGDHQWNYMLNNERWRTSQQMKKFYGDHDYLYDYYYGGKKHKVLRKENLEKDLLLFLEDEDGVKSNILQSELNDLLAYEKDKEDFKGHYLYETEQKEREMNFDRVNKIKQVISQGKNKKLAAGKRGVASEYPDEAPPQMINNWHPKLANGEHIANRYNKLDPQSAEAMPKTGNPHIDAKVEKAKNNPDKDGPAHRQNVFAKIKKARG